MLRDSTRDPQLWPRNDQTHNDGGVFGRTTLNILLATLLRGMLRVLIDVGHGLYEIFSHRHCGTLPRVIFTLKNLQVNSPFYVRFHRNALRLGNVRVIFVQFV